MLKKFVNDFFEETDTVSSGKFNFKTLIGNKRNIIFYLLSILVSRVGLAAGVNPFGLAFLGAMQQAGIPLLLPLLIIGITTAISFGWMALLKFVISSVVFALLKSFVKFGENKTGNTVKILFAAAVGEIVSLGISGGLLYDALLAVYSALTSAIFYLIFAEGLPVIMDFRQKKDFLFRELNGDGNFSSCGD